MSSYISTPGDPRSSAGAALPLQKLGGREALERYVREQIPMGCWATAEEVAESILFLAADRSCFMTGRALVVAGGACMA